MPRSRRGRDEGSVYQRESDGRWVGSMSHGFTHAGKRDRRIVYGETKAEVQRKLRQLQADKDAGKLPDRPGGPTVGEWLAYWLTVVAPTVEPGTLKPYSNHVRLHITPAPIARIRLAKLRVENVEVFYAGLLAAGKSPAMTKKVGVTLTVALNHAVRHGKMQGNPAASRTGAKKPKTHRPEVEYMTAEQAKAFADVCPGNRFGPLMLTLLDTGMRPGEAFALQRPDIDLKARMVRVTKSLEEIDGQLRIKKPKTKKAIRQIDIHPDTARVIAEHLGACSAAGHTLSAPVFCDTKGGYLRLDKVHRYGLKPLLKSAGIPDMGLYCLRHTCATMLLLMGQNPKVVSERLGHSTVTLTLDTYSHVLPTMQAAAAGVIGSVLYGPSDSDGK